MFGFQLPPEPTPLLLDGILRCPRCGSSLRGVRIWDAETGKADNHPYYKCENSGQNGDDTLYLATAYERILTAVLHKMNDGGEILDYLIQEWDERRGPNESAHRRLGPSDPRFASRGQEFASLIGRTLLTLEPDVSPRVAEHRALLAKVVQRVELEGNGFRMYLTGLDVPVDVAARPGSGDHCFYIRKTAMPVETNLTLSQREWSRGVGRTVPVFGEELTLQLPPNITPHAILRLRNAVTPPGESSPRDLMIRLMSEARPL